MKRNARRVVSLRRRACIGAFADSPSHTKRDKSRKSACRRGASCARWQPLEVEVTLTPTLVTPSRPQGRGDTASRYSTRVAVGQVRLVHPAARSTVDMLARLRQTRFVRAPARRDARGNRMPYAKPRLSSASKTESRSSRSGRPRPLAVRETDKIRAATTDRRLHCQPRRNSKRKRRRVPAELRTLRADRRRR